MLEKNLLCCPIRASLESAAVVGRSCFTLIGASYAQDAVNFMVYGNIDGVERRTLTEYYNRIIAVDAA